MASTLSKEHSLMAYPRTFLTIIAYVVGLAMFLCLASSLLISQPIGSTVRSYFYGVDSSQKSNVASSVNGSFVDTPVDKFEIEGQRDSTEFDKSKTNDGKAGDWKSNGEADGIRGEVGKKVPDSDLTKVDRSSESSQGKTSNKTTPVDTLQNSTAQTINQDSNNKSNGRSSDDLREGDGEKHEVTKSPENSGSLESGQGKDFLNSTSTGASENSTTSTYLENVGGVENTTFSSEDTKKRETDSIDSECDLYHGKWVYDSAGPLYTNNSCPVLTQMQNCQGNGRPDKDYENFRWKPNQCDLPRFNPRKFLELMRGKTIAFIGDSVARNQMESMLCILWQAEEPQNRGNKKMQRYFFKSTSTTIVRIWSSWLVHQTTEPIDYAPAGVTKLHLDAPDEGFMQYIKEFDVVVLSSGHWFAKQSVYILNNEIVGGQLWWPDKSKKMKVNNIEAFGISVETILSSMASDANYSGITIVRSYSPDHYEGGTWNTGGSCTGKAKPATDSELVENGFTNIMHEKQVTGFNRAIKKQTNKSTLKLMDITQVFSYRHDGHPGPYRSLDPNKITKRGPDGKPPPQDCLHWCMPGPVDTWNELVAEIIRQEFEHKTVSS